MGFLDFLKKDKPAPVIHADTVQMPPPPGAAALSPALPEDPSQIDWNAPPKVGDVKRPERPENSVPTAAMLSTPLRRDPLPPELDHDTDDFESVPLPPVSMQDPDFLDSAADDMNLLKETPRAAAPVMPVAPAEPVKPAESAESAVPAEQAKPEKPPVSKIELPDFTDEEIAAFDASIQHAKPSVQIVTEEPIIEPPANAVAIPEEELKLPTGELLEFGKLEPAKFLSSESYFAITGDIKAIRKGLRQNDDVIKETTLRHEQLDLQFKRVASDMNAVQEHFMKIDEALFE